MGGDAFVVVFALSCLQRTGDTSNGARRARAPRTLVARRARVVRTPRRHHSSRSSVGTHSHLSPLPCAHHNHAWRSARGVVVRRQSPLGRPLLRDGRARRVRARAAALRGDDVGGSVISIIVVVRRYLLVVERPDDPYTTTARHLYRRAAALRGDGGGRRPRRTRPPRATWRLPLSARPLLQHNLHRARARAYALARREGRARLATLTTCRTREGETASSLHHDAVKP